MKKWDNIAKYSKFVTAPLEPVRLFSSREAEDHFNSAPENVKKAAMNLLEKTIKNSMIDIGLDMICNELDALEARVRALESKPDNPK